MNFEGLSIELTVENDVAVIKLSGKTKDIARDLKLNILSDTMAVSVGIGRNSGETVRVLENGNIFYSGFEFTKGE